MVLKVLPPFFQPLPVRAVVMAPSIQMAQEAGEVLVVVAVDLREALAREAPEHPYKGEVVAVQ